MSDATNQLAYRHIHTTSKVYIKQSHWSVFVYLRVNKNRRVIERTLCSLWISRFKKNIYRLGGFVHASYGCRHWNLEREQYVNHVLALICVQLWQHRGKERILTLNVSFEDRSLGEMVNTWHSGRWGNIKKKTVELQLSMDQTSWVLWSGKERKELSHLLSERVVITL